MCVCVSVEERVCEIEWEKESENDRERGLFETDDIFFSMYNIFP